jgi:hypothetical protein
MEEGGYRMIKVIAHKAALGGIEIASKVEFTPVVPDVMHSTIKVVLDFDPFQFP